jgi:hypothetical protein
MDNITKGSQIGWGGIEWIDVALDRYQWSVLVYTVMILE